MAAMLQRQCPRCSTEFEAKTARAVYCSASCRAMASQDRKAHPMAHVTSLPGAKGAGTIEAAVLKKLGNQHDTVVGRQAMVAARRMDAGVSDSSFAPMSRRLDELLEVAEQQAALAAASGADQDNPIAYLRKRAEERANGQRAG